MERKEIKVNFEKSGVKTLSGFGSWFIILGSIAVFIFIVSLVNPENAYLAVGSLCVSIGLFLGGAICKGLSGIARSALYQREVLRQEYIFYED